MELDKEFNKLKELSIEMERDDITLDDSVKKYYEACDIIEKCVKELSEVKGKVTVLRSKIDNMIEENFD